MTEISVRIATDDNDVIAIHCFLCVVAGPGLPGEIAPKESIEEIWRVVNRECALMAMQGDMLVGTLGIIKTRFWWGKVDYFANRWFFALPGLGAGRKLLAEGTALAESCELELHIIDEAKGRLKIFNRNPKRNTAPILAPISVAPPVAPPPTVH